MFPYLWIHRFLTLIQIARNIAHLRKLRKLSQVAFARELGITKSRIGAYEESRAAPPLELLIKLSDYFKLPIDVLVKKDLTKGKEEPTIEIGDQRVLFPIIVDEHNNDLIEIVPAKASAGYLNGYADPEYIESLQLMKLPFIPTGKHRAFPIRGDSMLPLKDGSYVVGKFVEDVRDIKDGNTYVIISKDEGIVYKRLYYHDHNNRHTLKLASDNKVYDPYEIRISDILEIWEYVCSINTNELDVEDINLSSVMGMLRKMQVELKSLKE